ncbi:hypothetical protein A1F94_013744 [Pyrenophora tritici-repentis]|uniref:Uncharacterized protein n=1 Tax=Pyrenophora tritici-repentis TaxID=45151 RepID=A0A316ZL97_9PLEO|nr:hypothetical protein PtrM4_073580 [Pyrenophora tritici-repentis]KAG9375688.1 hypothetical protein A1F94_013744 [Pyrenophora tritici-repentis]KAI1676917.1 hypothetical protein KJE20_13006 [Pyrenophora tritici-repentis]KAJ9535044.1 hypothetical protein PtrV1_14056 [Pyrenophora tritici-repentis]
MLWSKYRRLESEHSSEELLENEKDKEFDDSEIKHRKRPSGWPPKRLIGLFSATVIIILALYGTVDLTRRTYSAIVSTKRDNSCYCGTSVAEAISNNCIYDLLASAWLPEHCRDEGLTAEFDQAGPGPGGAWDYFADANGSVAINPTDVGYLSGAEPGTQYWTTNEWHIMHCVYYWLKQYRSKDTGVVVEARYDNELHIRHCGKAFLHYIPKPYYVHTVNKIVFDSSDRE